MIQNTSCGRMGFTLIELLVVISIVSLLSSIILTTLNTARAKARDAERLSDFHQIQLALALFYEDRGTYPNYLPGQPITCAKGIASNQPLYINCWNDFVLKLLPWLQLPVDPLDPSRFYYYRTQKQGSGYYILMSPELLDPNSGDQCSSHSYYCKGVNW